jgi:radical SAM superfamily enzyme YgiQ (UPF0313 family)
MSDIVLIYPAMTGGRNPHGSVLPLCFAWMAAVLEQNGLSVRVLDLQVEDADLIQVLREENPQCVGVSGTTQSRFNSFKIIEAVKSIDRDIVTLYGGPHATPAAEDTLQHIRSIDAVVRNEGELTVLEIMSALKKHRRIDFAPVAGVSFYKDGRVVHNPARPFIRDLDQLPLPAWHLFRMESYRQTMEFLDVPGHAIVTSRGCPFQCSFCSARLLWGRRYAARSAQNVADEVQHLAERYGIQGFKIFDSTFTVNRRHVLAICSELKKRGLHRLPWECEIRADTVDLELLQEMQSAGCYYIDMGLESASARVLKQICKGVTLKQVQDVIGWCNDLGLMTKLFLTWGHPTETYREALETVRFMERNLHRVQHMAAHVGILIYPGTGVEAFAREQGLLPADFSWSGPYHEAANGTLGSDSSVPLLLQPQMNRRHLARIFFKIHWKPLLTFSNVFRKIWACVWNRESRRRHLNTLIELCNQRFNRHIRPLGG